MAQGGVCGICGKPPKPGKNLVVDHDHHKDGVVRGLLCAYCNHYVMGRLTLAKARAVVAYLEGVGNGYGQVPAKRRRKRPEPGSRGERRVGDAPVPPRPPRGDPRAA